MTCTPSPLQAHTPCPVCASSEATLVSVRSRTGEPLRTVVCQGCGLGRTDPLPTAAEQEEFYRRAYRADYKGTLRPHARHVWRAGRVARERLASIGDFLPARARLLDVGSGGGEMAWFLRRAGHEVAGIEPNRGYREFSEQALGVQILASGWEEARIAGESLDAVTCFHVLEHLTDPHRLFACISGWLRPGGVFVLEVPDLTGHAGHPANRYHRAHVTHYSMPVLLHLAAHHRFEAVHAWVSRDGGNAGTVLRRVGLSPGALSTAPLAGNAARVLRLLGQHTPWSYLASAQPVSRLGRKLVMRAVETWNCIGREPAADLLGRAGRA